MVCPRCGGSLTAYRLSDAETVSCEDCSYIGVSVDHTSTDGERESWDEAIDRFYEQHRDGSVESDDVEVFEDDIDVLDDADKIKPTYALATDADKIKPTYAPADGADPEQETDRTEDGDAARDIESTATAESDSGT